MVTGLLEPTENCRGQAWGFDLMMAAILFTAGIIVFFLYSINYPTEGKETLDKLFYEGNIIADNLLSEGSPDDWDSSNVARIGILNDNKINQTKLERFSDLASADYQKTRVLFNTKYDYFFNLSETIIIDSDPIEGIGSSFQNQNPTNLIKITRLTVYNNKPVTLNIYIWEK